MCRHRCERPAQNAVLLQLHTPKPSRLAHAGASHAPTPPRVLSLAAVRLFELTPSWSEPGFFQRRLVEAWEFDGSALEFGGDRRCQKEPKGVLQKAAEEVRDGVAAVV